MGHVATMSRFLDSLPGFRHFPGWLLDGSGALLGGRTARTRWGPDRLAEGPLDACGHAPLRAEPSLPAAVRRIPPHPRANWRHRWRILHGCAADAGPRALATSTRTAMEDGQVVQIRRPVTGSSGSGASGSRLRCRPHRCGPGRVLVIVPILDTETGGTLESDSTSLTNLARLTTPLSGTNPASVTNPATSTNPVSRTATLRRPIGGLGTTPRSFPGVGPGIRGRIRAGWPGRECHVGGFLWRCR